MGDAARFAYGSLPANLAAFCAMLRRDYAFRIGTREVHDAARAIETVGIATERAVRDALRPVLSSSFEQVAVFDDAFRRFFYGDLAADARAPRPERSASTKGGASNDDDTGHASPPDASPDRDDTTGGHDGAVAAVDDLDSRDQLTLQVVRSAYSPLEGGSAAPILDPPDPDWRGAAHALLRRIRATLSRRWRPAPRGPRFDLRRTLRRSLHTGGEAVTPRWQARPRHLPRIVILIDGSRSMRGHVDPSLKMAVALASATPSVEAFTFSTTLARVTGDVRRAAAGERRRLPRLHHAWGGGTSIGASLREFGRRYGDRLLGRNTLVIITSDGLDVGAPDVLRNAMALLRRRSAAIVWLNPLLPTPGYEPTALGMRVARPYVTKLASVTGPRDLLGLPDGLRLRTSA
jgi:uncharacterized protein